VLVLEMRTEETPGIPLSQQAVGEKHDIRRVKLKMRQRKTARDRGVVDAGRR